MTENCKLVLEPVHSPEGANHEKEKHMAAKKAKGLKKGKKLEATKTLRRN